MEGANLTEAITSAFAGPLHSVAYQLTQRLTELAQGAFLLESQDHDFDVGGYAHAGHCTATAVPEIVSSEQYYWRDSSARTPRVGAWWIDWPHEGESVRLCYIFVSWSTGSCETVMRYAVAPTREIAEEFFTSVCEWNAILTDEVLVFDRGYWDKHEKLYADIKRTSLEELILPPGMREEIVSDLQRFIDRRTDYDRMNVPWKRGVLLAGPPGNGKTMSIKALANTLRLPSEDGETQPIDCLYVRSLAEPNLPDHYTIGAVFERARRSAPCLLIFEDVDSLVTDENRSVFLNELDGLAINSGIVVVASTNHVGRLDPALRSRPSRFDRTWHFDLPGPDERRRFLLAWSERAETKLRLNTQACEEIAGLTDGFSFAYLKELMVSSLMRWIDAEASADLANVVMKQVDLLRTQMAEAELPPGASTD